MKKLAIIGLILLVWNCQGFSQAKPGGIAREAAMGGSQAGTGLALNPFIMDDPALMLVNPAYQASYSNYGWSNIGGGTLSGLSTGNNGYGQQNAGVSFALNSDWNLGAIFGYDPSAVNFVSTLMGASPPLVPHAIAQRPLQVMPGVANVWELLASVKMSSMVLGFGVSYGSSDNHTTNTNADPRDAEASAHVWGFRAGTDIDLGNSSSLDVSAAVHFDGASDNATIAAGSGGEYSVSATEIQISARAKFHVSNKVNFVPYGLFATASAEPKEDKPPQGATATLSTAKVSATAYALGIGGEYRNQGFYLAGGLSFQSAQVKSEVKFPAFADTSTTTAKFTALPTVNLGAEWQILDWLAGRIGYFRLIGNTNTKTEGSANTEEITFSAPFSNILVGGLNPATWDGVVTLGVGFKFGGFALDATVSDEALRRGLGLIGAQDNINTFGYMTGSYYFGD